VAALVGHRSRFLIALGILSFISTVTPLNGGAFQKRTFDLGLPLYPHLDWNLLVDQEDRDLLKLYEEEISSVSSKEDLIRSQESEKRVSLHLRSLNKNIISNFLSETSIVGNSSTFSRSQAQYILDHINQHPVVRSGVAYLYDPQQGQVGFCFMRAQFAYLELLRHGLPSSSIRKIFAIGGLVYQNTIWDYHVATMVLGKENKWWVIDGLFAEVLELEEWLRRISLWDGNQIYPMLRFYITPAWKFQPIPPVHPSFVLYQRLYGSYFRDLLVWRYSNIQNFYQSELPE
jgi:hypothetical protein